MKIKFVTFGGQIFSNQIRLCVYLLSKQVPRHAEPLVTKCKVYSVLLTEKMAWYKKKRNKKLFSHDDRDSNIQTDKVKEQIKKNMKIWRLHRPPS